METKVIKNNGISAAVVTSAEKLIVDVQSALDFIMSVQYETQCSRIALNKEAVCEEFFVLSTCLAGEILQKFINYHIKFAVYGDFSNYSSKPLKDYESNQGNDVFFLSNENEAVEKLLSAK